MAKAYITLNDKTLERERVGIPIAVTPGEVSAVAQLPDGKRVKRSVSVAAGATKTITLSVAASADPLLPADPSDEADSVAPEDDRDEGPGWFSATRGAGIAVAAVGVAGIVVFAVFNASADDKLAQLEAECGGQCPNEAKYTDLISEGETAETVAAIALGVGIASILAGTAMLIFGAPDDGEEIAIAPSPGGAAIAVRF